MITIKLSGQNLTTADLGWLQESANGAAGHSGNDYPIIISEGSISVEIPGEDEEIEKLTESRPLKIGDRVRVIVAQLGDGPIVGKTGVLLEKDPNDPGLPYHVRLDDRDTGDWVKSVERISD